MSSNGFHPISVEDWQAVPDRRLDVPTPDAFLLQGPERGPLRITALQMVATFTRIVCPACASVQGAMVQRAITGWPVYVHQCAGCGYLVTESEWLLADDLGL